MKKRQISNYKFLGNCPICNTKFSSKMTSSMGESRDLQTLYVECVNCGSSVVLGIIKNIPGLVTTVGMLTDMNLGDLNRLKDFSPISSDDVLEIHKHLESK